VVAFCASDREKKEVVMKAGADYYVDMRDPQSVATAPKVSVFIETLPVNRDLNSVLPLMSLNGMYVRMGIPPAGQQTFTGDWLPFIFSGKGVRGSIVTGSQRMKMLLKLASDHLEFLTDMSEGTKAVIRPFSELEVCMKELREQKNKAFRTVLAWE
jgi:D-arabinose 1-dehydrogenase-like Zn-dependent alcohol dehydrogenase